MPPRPALPHLTILCLLTLSLFTTAHALPPQSDHAELQVVPAPGSVKVDGVLGDEEWDKTGRMHVYPAKAIRNRYAVDVYAMWDKDALYLGLHYKDPTPLINNVDAAASPFDGWQSDGTQFRLITDYPQIHIDAWYSSLRDITSTAISYNGPVNLAQFKGLQGPGMAMSDPSGYAQAFKKDADDRGYVQEIRLPWSLIYQNTPNVAAGLTFGFTGEYYWGGPMGIKWPKVLWADPLNPQFPQRVVIYQNPNAWGKARLLAEGNLPVEPIEEDEAVTLEGTKLIQVDVPVDTAKITVVIDDAHGKRVRNLAANTDAALYVVSTDAAKGTKRLEIPWDGRGDGLWNKERYLFVGDVVEPGDYRVTVLPYGGLGVAYEGSFYNPGTPPWSTADGSGAWLSDHSPPFDIASLSPTASNTVRTLVTSGSGETGEPLIGLDAAGNRRWFFARHGSHIEAVAAGDTHMFFAVDYAGGIWLGKLNPDNGQQVNFDNGVLDTKLPHKVHNLAVRGDRIAIAYRDGRGVELRHTTTGEVIQTMDTPAFDVALAPDGTLYHVHEGTVFRAGEPMGLSDIKAYCLAVDAQGLLYVSDSLTQTVKVFEGTRLVRTIGKPGGRPAGKVDLQQMSYPLSITLDERADGTKWLWVVESGSVMRRVVAWDLTQEPATIVADRIGNTGYQASGGSLSDHVPDLGLYQSVHFKIDYDTGAYTPIEIVGTNPVPGKVQPFHGNSGPAFSNPYHFLSSASGQKQEYHIARNGGGYGVGIPTIWMRDDRQPSGWRCVAAFGLNNQFEGLWPAELPQASGDNTLMIWSDTDEDGFITANEVTWTTPPSREFMHWGDWGYRCFEDLTWYSAGYAFRPVRFTSSGAPVYSVESIQQLPGELGKIPSAIFKTPNGYIAGLADPRPDPHGTIHGLHYISFFNESGELLWKYPSYWIAVHGGFTAPQSMNGVIMGALKTHGVFEHHGMGHIAIRGNHGQDFILREDGLFLSELFTDQRQAPELMPPSRDIRGVPINDTTLGGECFSGTMVAHPDGKVRLTFGMNDVRIAAVTGFDKVREPLRMPLSFTAQDKAAADAFVPGQKAQRITELTLTQGDAFDVNSYLFTENDAQLIAGRREEVGRVAARFDSQNLYVLWEIDDLTPWQNAGNEPAAAFKSGDAVEVIVGGTRLVLAPLQGGKAVAMRPQGPGDAPYTYTSPVRSSVFAYVAEQPEVTMTSRVDAQGYRVAAVIPWTVLNAQPTGELRGDFGVIFGRSDTTTLVERIVRWVDRQTNVVNDLPTEAEFDANRAGTWKLP